MTRGGVCLGLVLLLAVVANVESQYPTKDLVKLPPRVCGPVCAIFCPFGNKRDSRGCPTCTCNKPPPRKCGPICRMFCPNGFVKDKNGCPICKCKPVKPILPPIKPPICGPVCMIACPFGNVLDSRGCPTCRCKPGPISPRTCPRGSVIMRPRRSCGKNIIPIFGRDECGSNGFCYRGNRGRGICCRKFKITPPKGKCPKYRGPKFACVRAFDQCKSDRDCKIGRCCPGRCGRVCTPVLPRLPFPLLPRRSSYD